MAGRGHCSVRSSVCVLVPNTAVFGPTNFIGMIMITIMIVDEKGRFLNLDF